MSANIAAHGPVRQAFGFLCCREQQVNEDITSAKTDKMFESDTRQLLGKSHHFCSIICYDMVRILYLTTQLTRLHLSQRVEVTPAGLRAAGAHRNSSAQGIACGTGNWVQKENKTTHTLKKCVSLQLSLHRVTRYPPASGGLL